MWNDAKIKKIYEDEDYTYFIESVDDEGFFMRVSKYDDQRSYPAEVFRSEYIGSLMNREDLKPKAEDGCLSYKMREGLLVLNTNNGEISLF